MSRLDQPEPPESHGNLQADAAEGARAALSTDSFPPVPDAAGCVGRNSSALQGFPQPDQLIELSERRRNGGGIPVERPYDSPLQLPTPAAGGRVRTPDNSDAGLDEANLQVSADAPNAPAPSLSEAQRRKLDQDMQPIPGEGQAGLLWRLKKA